MFAMGMRENRLLARGAFIWGDFNVSDFSTHCGYARARYRQYHAGIGSRHFPKERFFNEWMYGDVPEVIRRSELQTVLPENVEDKSIVCSACGRRGADIRPDFLAARMGTNA
jgi:hypothetical protein